MNDVEIINALGGVNAVAKHLGYNYTTVHNWLSRGIPSKEKITHPKLFMPKDIKKLKQLP